MTARQPASPSARNFFSSVGGPISGVGSSFQSPVCKHRAERVRMISAFDSGIEWATETNSISNGPSVRLAAEGYDS